MSYLNSACAFIALGVAEFAVIGLSTNARTDVPAAATAPAGLGSVNAPAPSIPGTLNGNPALTNNAASGVGNNIAANGVETTMVENPDGSRTQTIKYPPGILPLSGGSNAQASPMANAPLSGGSGQPGPVANTPNPASGNAQLSPSTNAAVPAAGTLQARPAGPSSVRPLLSDGETQPAKTLSSQPQAQIDQEIHVFGPVLYPVTRYYRYSHPPVHCDYGYTGVQCVYVP